MKQESYVMVKPYFANYSKVIDYIKNVLKEHGVKIVEEGYIKYDDEMADRHYREHIGKAFYPELKSYITSDVAYGMKVEGENAIQVIRELAGSTKNPAEGTIRFEVPKMLGIERDITRNVVHSSDSEEAVKNELPIFEELKKRYNDEEEGLSK